MQDDSRVPGWTFRKIEDRYILGSASLFLLTLILGLLLSHWITWVLCGLFGIVFGMVLYFFRDPRRILERDQNIYYSPADGKVTDITTVSLPDLSESDFLRIGIFMSILDVHVQRSPVSGEVDFVSHQPGKNYPAYDPAASVENDQITMGIRTRQGLILVKQIAGILARKCVNYAKPEERITSGQRYGLIKFGSRVELFLPPDVSVITAIGNQVFGGITPLAEIKDG